MKKRVRVFLSILLAVVLLGGGYLIGSIVGVTVNINYNTGETNAAAATTQTTAATTAPITAPTVATTAATTAPITAPTAVAPGPTAVSPDTSAASDATTAAPAVSGVPTTKEDVVARFNSVINAIKASTDSLKVTRSEKITMALKSCDVALAKPLLTPIIKSLSTDKTSEIAFSGGNGTNADGNAVTLDEYLAPYGRTCALDPAGVATATANDLGGGSYELNIQLSPESSSFDGTNTVDPIYHQQIMDPLNLATIDLGDAAKIASASMAYSGAVLKATVGADGMLSSYSLTCPMDGTGTGKVSRFELTVGVGGESVYNWTFTK